MISPAASPAFENLLERSQRNLFHFVNMELALGTTFAELAEVERGHGQPERVQHSIEIAASALRTARRFASKLSGDELREEVESRCLALENRISRE